jgi:uncharacterized membrane protein YfcA
LSASAVGGYLGARLGRRLSPPVARGLVVALAGAVTVAFFIQLW